MNVVAETEAASEASAAAAATNATTAQAKPAQPCIKIHNFSDEFMDTPIYFQVTCLQDSYLIWMGTCLPRLADLCVAVPTRYDTLPSASTLLGEGYVSDFSSVLAQRLAKRLKGMVFISCNTDQRFAELEVFMERRLVQELKALSILK
ncbi:hypothetical protein QOT17_022308 [Balamuthia mandrillaris]